MASSSDLVGFDELTDQLSDLLKNVEEDRLYETLELGASELVSKASKLSSPYSSIRKSGYTHLVNTFAYKRNTTYKDVAVGWGKYHGRMVEGGTRKMRAQAHLVPLWNKEKEAIHTKMIKHLGFD